jgi:glutamate decarboxylase
MLTSNPAKGVHHPDHEYGRPEKENFGDGQIEGGQEQSGFSRQC